MDTKLIFNFTFKPVKTPRKKVSTGIKRISKMTTGLVIIEHGDYKVRIFSNDYSTSSGDLVLEFTPDSYELKGRETIFTKVISEEIKVTRIIRTQLHSLSFPGSNEKYVPFAPNWIVKGHIVEKDNKKYFEFSDIVTINGYDMK